MIRKHKTVSVIVHGDVYSQDGREFRKKVVDALETEVFKRLPVEGNGEPKIKKDINYGRVPVK